MNTKLSGNLIIIGGAEDKEGKKEILNRVCDCINKDNDTLIVATVATKYPEEAARKYKKAFGGNWSKTYRNIRYKQKKRCL